MKLRLAVGRLALAWLVLGIGSGWGQDTATDPLSGINITLPSGEVQVLTLTPGDMPELKKLSNAQLEIVVKALDAMPTVPFADLPKHGTIGNFFSLQNPGWPPLPFNSSKSDVWDFGTFFILNDINYAYVTSTTAVSESSDAKALVSGPPAPGGGSTNPAPKGQVYPTPNYGTNLYIAQVNVSGGYFNAVATNTIADVEYQVLSATNLLEPMSNWLSESTFYGSEATNYTSFSVVQGNRTDLFIRLLSWQSNDGSGLPSWWELEYFGTNPVNPYGEAKGDGWSNLQKFYSGWNPNAWYTPPAPQGVTVVYNAASSTVKVTWLPSPGPVTGYAVREIFGDPTPDLYFGLPMATNTHNLGVVTSWTGAVSPTNAIYYTQIGDPTLYESYQVVGVYGASNSLPSTTVPLETPLAAQLAFGSQTNGYLEVQNLPAGTTNVCVSEYDESTDQPVSKTYIYVTTNGLYALPPNTDLSDGTERWWAQAGNTNGGVSEGAQLYNADLDGDGLGQAWFDGRKQLKQNLIFYLRAALANYPFQLIPSDIGINIPNVPSSASNYTASGVGDYPFQANVDCENFVFNLQNINGEGGLDTGVEGGYPFDWVDPYAPVFNLSAQLYTFVAPTTLTGTIPAVLATNSTRWLCSFSDYNIGNAYGLDVSQFGLIPSGDTYMLANNASNLFGLKFLSVMMADSPTVTNIVFAGNNIGGYYEEAYVETAQPQFKTVEYDCWYSTLEGGTDLSPEQGGFTATNKTGFLVTSVGAPYYSVAGFAKLGLVNGYTNVYAYLGQYFANAYAMATNGSTTATNTGVLSPTGNFLATQPGDVALVTMPDVDTGQQGTNIIHVISLAVDANHDGTMDTSLNGPDTTSLSSPYVFWCNNNYDRWATVSEGWGFIYTDVEQDDQVSAPTPDYNYSNAVAHSTGYRAIPCTRDLEDFSRLWLCGFTSNLLATMPTNAVLTLSWLNGYGMPLVGNPTIDLFAAADPDGGIGYQTNETTATTQTNVTQCPYVGRLGPGQTLQLNSLNKVPYTHFIWCGVSNGTAGLALTLSDVNSNVLAQSTAYIQIVDIKQMYERFSVGDNSTVVASTLASNALDNLPVGQAAFNYPLPAPPNTPYILHVHGFNVSTFEKARYAETEYKRLYWQGYQGRFGAFDWPTTEQGVLNATSAFDISESNAWGSATGLLNLLTTLNSEYPGNVYLTAHSHGNVVAGEALLRAGRNQLVNTYVALQAAVPAHAYDPSTSNRYAPTMPDFYAHYYTTSSPCYFNGSAGAGTYVNFLNTNDWALTGLWPVDQDLKPDEGFNYAYNGTNFIENISGVWPPSTYLLMLMPGDKYAIFSYCDPATCYALGAQTNVGGAFLTGTNYNQLLLPTIWPPDPTRPPYSAHIWHSAEFRSDYPQRWLFWNQALVKMKLK